MTARLLVLVMLLTPLLGDTLASACAKAPCCAMKNGSCPMHPSKSSNCRMSTCTHTDVALAQTPPVVHRATLNVVRHDLRVAAISVAEVALVAHVNAPPDPPPPRDRFSSIA